MRKIFDSGINSKLYFRFYLDCFYVSVQFQAFYYFQKLYWQIFFFLNLGSGAAAKTFDQYFVVANSRNY